ncbi:hypothetical protein BXZ70DRAFT_417191 [Cristinia sonorae]|uniref:Uncharacterized protein n=1 Tax=Cristinia sonorae TaxID=1940300 RepID=A0A8K0XTS3_9AGAR|nr:hypothetical protein BXZ70DRAFT_417191 [Cristinia sonorae]
MFVYNTLLILALAATAASAPAAASFRRDDILEHKRKAELQDLVARADYEDLVARQTADPDSGAIKLGPIISGIGHFLGLKREELIARAEYRDFVTRQVQSDSESGALFRNPLINIPSWLRHEGRHNDPSVTLFGPSALVNIPSWLRHPENRRGQTPPGMILYRSLNGLD